MKIKQHIKLFEDLEEEDFVKEGKDFDTKLTDFGKSGRERAKQYTNPLNQIKMDLMYNIKYANKLYLEAGKNGEAPNPDAYMDRIQQQIKGVLYKFSKGKYACIKEEDVDLVNELILSLVDKYLPHDKASYIPYDALQQIITEFEERILSENLFDPEAGFIWDKEAKEENDH